jgi:hypothetical protein
MGADEVEAEVIPCSKLATELLMLCDGIDELRSSASRRAPKDAEFFATNQDCSNLVYEMWRRRASSWTFAKEINRSEAQLDGWMARI